MTRILSSLAVVVSVSLVALATACGSSDGEKRGPVGPVPPGLERFYDQALSWGDCEDYAKTDTDRQALGGKDLECTRLTVPLDYANPAGDTITLGVLRLPAGEERGRIGSLLINPGGPGVAGMSTAARLGTHVRQSELGKRFDFVGFDPRGVGASEPSIECLTDAERDAERAEDDELDSSPAGVAKVEAEARDYSAKCVQRTDKGVALLANMGSRDVAKDMDVLRSVLGDEKLNYLGYSYGTRIGTTYAEAFPGNVRALVLDGALDPDQDPVDELVAQGAGFQKAFEAFVAWCTQRQDCALGRDSDGATSAFHALTRPLGERPLDLGNGRKLSYSDATTGVVQALYAQQLWEPLNTGLNELKRGRGDILMLLADTYYERGTSGTYSSTQDAFTAVRCVDDPRVTDREVATEAQRRYREVAPFLDDGRPVTAALDECAFWPVPNTGEPHLPRVPGLPPTLVISTTGDPATPYQAGVNLAKALGGGLLSYQATQHTIALQGNRCVDDAVTAYLINLTLPAQDTHCS